MLHNTRPILRLGHSPDPDDAFMWWPLFARDGQPPRLNDGRFRFVQVTADIETLNQRSGIDGQAANDLLEITAISCAQYPHVQDRYILTSCGSSMGEQYGPKLVARDNLSIEQLRTGTARIAIPGLRTSAFAALTMMLGKDNFQHEVVPFEQIIDRVADGSFTAGLVIHEGQLTFERCGLWLIADLGQWWWSQHGLPLPLGINVVRRDLETQYGSGSLREIAATLQQSLEYAMSHREESVQVAMEFARGISAELADEFIALYVNKWTIDFGPVGRQAVATFLQASHDAGLTPAAPNVDWIE